MGVEVPQWAWRCVSHSDHSNGDAGGRSTGLYRAASSPKWTVRSLLKWTHPPARSSCSVRRAARNPGALRRRRGPPGGRPGPDARREAGSPSEPLAADPPGDPLSTGSAGSHRARPRTCPTRPRTQSSLRPSIVSLSELETHKSERHYYLMRFMHRDSRNSMRTDGWLTWFRDVELDLNGLVNLAVVMVQITSINPFVSCDNSWKK